MRAWLIVGFGVLKEENVTCSPSEIIDELCRNGWNGLLIPYVSSLGYYNQVYFSQLMTLSEPEYLHLSVEQQMTLIKKRLGMSGSDMAIITTLDAIAEQAQSWLIPALILKIGQSLEEHFDDYISRKNPDLCILCFSDLSHVIQAIRYILNRSTNTGSNSLVSLILSFDISSFHENMHDHLSRLDKNRPSLLQSYQYREGIHVQADLMQIPLIATSITYGSSPDVIRHRKDTCERTSLMEIAEKGAMSRLALAQFLPELAFRLGKIPKYGA
jgi:hypothetical protein